MSKDANPNEIYDAIVVGSGISGGWAAKELCENGMKTLVLERGPMVEHIKSYTTANMDPWDFKFFNKPTRKELARQEKQARTGYVTREDSAHWFVDDLKHPYNEIKRFDWIRGYHVGGRSITWGRQSYRWSDIDFGANKKEGLAVDWPVRYNDIAPWYTKVEQFIGVSGEALGLPQLPDSEFLPPMDLTCVEDELRQQIASHYDDGRLLTIGRCAHITAKADQFEGREQCQYRNRCMRGCPFGAYFASVSSTLPAAERTGNLTIRANSIVTEIIYDDQSQLATGVRIVDRETKKEQVFEAKVIFLCASAIASASILMNSKSERFKNGLGNDSDQLGRNVMDHHFKVGARGTTTKFKDQYYSGRRANGIYIPRFRNLGGNTDAPSFIRGYGYQGGSYRGDDFYQVEEEKGYGPNLVKALTRPGQWTMSLTGFGEVLPQEANRMTLDYDKRDEWDQPTVTFDVAYGDNEHAMRQDMETQAVDMLKKAGFDNVKGFNEACYPGIGIHEMGTARMGRDPKTSILDGNNAVHTVQNVFVTDGAFMTSSSCVNPSLTYMAFSARAANHAATLVKNGKFNHHG